MSWSKSAIADWRKFQGLPWPERRLLVQAVALLPLTAVMLRLVGLRRWQSVLAKQAPPLRRARDVRDRAAQRTARLVRAAAQRGLYRGNCLQQSLLLWWLLRRQGISSELLIGVRKEGGRFEAHAWVECGGDALNESVDVQERFAPFHRAIASDRTAS